MLRNYSKMKNLLLPEYTLITDTKTPKKDFSLVYMSNKDDIIGFINNNTLFKQNMFLSYFYPNRDKEDSIRKNLLERQTVVYKNMKKMAPKIKKVKTDISEYEKFNLYFDFYPYFDFFNYKLIAPTDRVLSDKFITFVGDKVKPVLDTYSNVLVYMNINKELLDDTEDNSRDFYYMFGQALFYNKQLTFPYDIIIKGEVSKYSLFFPKNEVIEYKTAINKMKILEKLERKDGTEFTPEELTVIKQDAASVDNSENLSKELSKEQIKKEVLKKLNVKVDRMDGKDTEIQTVVSELVDKQDNINENDILKQYLANLNQEEENKKVDILKERRVKSLNEKYAKVKFKGRTLDDILNDAPNNELTRKEVKINHTNKSLTKSLTLSEFEPQYNAKQKNKDIVSVLTAFTNDKDIKLIPTEIKIEDTSTQLDKKETMTVSFQDDSGTNHTFVLDIPVMLDDRYIYLNGTKKNLNKQLIFKPIVKTGPNEVQIVTLSNKTFIYRLGTKINIAKENLIQGFNIAKVKYEKKNIESDIKDYRRNCEFDELIELFTKCTYKDISVNLNITEMIEDINSKFKVSLLDNLNLEKETPFLIKGNYIYTTDTKDGKDIVKYSVEKGKLKKEEEITRDMSLLILDLISETETTLYDNMDVKIGSNFMYASMTSMGTKIPVVLPLLQRFGLVKLLDKLKIEYTVTDKRRRLSNREKMDTSVVQLADCFIYYKASEHDILLNGLQKIDLTAYELTALDTDTPYIFIYEEFGSKHLVKGMPGYLDILLDPISKNYLIEMGFSKDITSEDLLIIACEMLNQNFYRRLNDMENYRIRSNEIIYAALMYDTVSTAFKKYKEAKKQGNKTVKVTVPPDTLLKKVTQITEDYSELNP